MTATTDWGLRSNQDEPDSDSFGGQNVYDVYSKSTGNGAGWHEVQHVVSETAS
jgi:hypothetical protein